MSIPRSKIIFIFRVCLLVIFIGLFVFILSRNIVLERSITYRVDFSRNYTKDIEGLYPQQRVNFDPASGQILVLAEPLYLRVYEPAKFKQLRLDGAGNFSGQPAKIGLKQQDESWQWQDISASQFQLDFDLNGAKRENNKLELIFSFPALQSAGEITFNNLVITLNR